MRSRPPPRPRQAPEPPPVDVVIEIEPEEPVAAPQESEQAPPPAPVAESEPAPAEPAAAEPAAEGQPAAAEEQPAAEEPSTNRRRPSPRRPPRRSAPRHSADQEAIVTGTQVAVGNSGANQTQQQRPAPTGSSSRWEPRSTPTTPTPSAAGTTNIIGQQADVVLTDQAVANILQIALILNIGAALANSGVNGVASSTPADPPTRGQIGTGDATASAMEIEQYVTQAAAHRGDPGDGRLRQPAGGVAVAGAGPRQLRHERHHRNRGRRARWLRRRRIGDGDRQRLADRHRPACGDRWARERRRRTSRSEPRC